MSEEPFLRARLTGHRFEGHKIPLEFLKDIAVLEEMVVEMAKLEYMKEHSERKRVPRRFTKNVMLSLAGVDHGSAVVNISIEAPNVLIPPEVSVYFERARDALMNAIAVAETSPEMITEYLEEKMLGYFDRFGRSLREGETMEFSNSGKEQSARLTNTTRKNLVSASTRIKELTEECLIRGSISEVDQDNLTFEVQQVNGKKIDAPIAPQHIDTVLEAFNGYQDGVLVSLQGVGRFSRSKQLLRYDSIEHITILDELDIAARFDSFRLLKTGWCEGRGEAPSTEGLDWLSQTFEQYYPDDIQLPHLYPTPEGGVQAEWSLDTTEASLEIDIKTHKGWWHVLNIETDGDTRDIDLDDEAGWQGLAEELRRLSRGAN